MKFEYDGYSAEIEIPEQHKNILINLSGGADSAIYFYLLVKYLKDNNRNDTNLQVLTGVFRYKNNATSQFSTNVLEWVMKELDAYDILKSHTKYYDYDFSMEKAKGLWWEYYRNKKATLITNALTSLPKDRDCTVLNSDGELIRLWDVKEGPSYEERDNDNKPNWNYAGPNNEYVFYEPFINVDKKFIKHLYEKYDLMDTLFPLTRSCECTEAEQCDDFKGHCGNCWWCLERKWAFGKL